MSNEPAQTCPRCGESRLITPTASALRCGQCGFQWTAAPASGYVQPDVKPLPVNVGGKLL